MAYVGQQLTDRNRISFYSLREYEDKLADPLPSTKIQFLRNSFSHSFRCCGRAYPSNCGKRKLTPDFIPVQGSLPTLFNLITIVVLK